MCKQLIRLALTAAAGLAGCSSGPSGEYGGADCGLYDKLSFRDDGRVYVSMKVLGIPLGEMAGEYQVDDDKVIVTVNKQTSVFTLTQAGDLEGTMLGEKIVCRKAAANQAGKPASKPPRALSAAYGGAQCMLDKLAFSEDGTVDLVLDQETQAGRYHTEGEQVIVQGPGGSIVFLLRGDALEAMVDGHRSVCSEL